MGITLSCKQSDLEINCQTVGGTEIPKPAAAGWDDFVTAHSPLLLGMAIRFLVLKIIRSREIELF